MTINTLQVIAPSTAMPGGPPGIQGPPGAFAVFGISSQTGATYTAQPNDTGKLVVFTNQTLGVAFTLTAAVALPGWWAIIKNNNVSGQIAITVTGGPLIDGLSGMTIDPKCTAQIIYTGVNFETFGPTDGGTF